MIEQMIEMDVTKERKTQNEDRTWAMNLSQNQFDHQFHRVTGCKDRFICPDVETWVNQGFQAKRDLDGLITDGGYVGNKIVPGVEQEPCLDHIPEPVQTEAKIKKLKDDNKNYACPGCNRPFKEARYLGNHKRTCKEFLNLR